MSAGEQTIWLELMREYYKIALSDALFYPQEGLDPTSILLGIIINSFSPQDLKVAITSKDATNKMANDYQLEFGVLLSLLTQEEIAQVAPALYYTYLHLNRKTNIENYKAMTTDHFWAQIEGPIQHTKARLKDIFAGDDLDHIAKFTIQFRRLSHSGLNKDTKTGSLNERVYNAQNVQGGTRVTYFDAHPEIKSHNIVITSKDIQNKEILDQKLFSIIYYMVKYQAFIVVKEGLSKDGKFIFGATLHKIFGVEYLKSLTSDGQWKIKELVVDSSKIKEWNSDWNSGDMWHDLNRFIPFYLFLDNNHIAGADALREHFRNKFNVDVENLIRSM